jgi:hypothetical protein
VRAACEQVARTGLSAVQGIDGAPDPRSIAALLDAIPGAYERARLGVEQARRGDTVALDEL